ncbi:alpha-N-acetylgalactosaminide alpha-2,6-sialyltransferase 5 isoform X3 [Hemitrygon akajei]|uniref:alpha-N-acetylgalactosaminide alpha-2,6-sialyltransferase 5 isoform X3 n=1 Tax=Hemitrygon akajei TaxID=2704970 RepID=UPI003BFA1321
MKKLVRHLIAVFLGLSTCGTLLVLYATKGERGADSNPPTSAERRNSVTRELPEPLPALTGYINFIDRKALQVHCNSCALVTSSGHLIGSKRGAEIDQVECVIRMNDAPTRGYQEDVGRRTSLRVVAHSSIQRLLQKGSELLNASRQAAFIFWGPSSCMRRDGKGRLYNQLQLIHRMAPHLKLHTISRQKMLHFDQLFKRETGKDRFLGRQKKGFNDVFGAPRKIVTFPLIPGNREGTFRMVFRTSSPHIHNSRAKGQTCVWHHGVKFEVGDPTSESLKIWGQGLKAYRRPVLGLESYLGV